MEQRTPRLGSAERHSIGALAIASVAAERLAAHVSLRILLERAVGAQWRGAPLTRSGHGKPHLEGAPVAFSLSHAPGLALIGLARSGLIGVDVERTRPVRVNEPRRGRIEAAAAALNAAQPLPEGADQRFLQAWVRLEALAKAQGCGLGRLLTRLGLIANGEVDSGALGERIAAVRGAALGAVVCDLRLGEGLYAAAALGPQRPFPQVCWLPDSAGGIEQLLA